MSSVLLGLSPSSTLQVRRLRMDENAELHPVLDQVPALELDCGGLDLLNSQETQLHYAAQVGLAQQPGLLIAALVDAPSRAL